MKIHHLNCGSMCPVGSRFFPSVFPKLVVCHCLLVETANALVLVDTGIGLKDVEKPSRLGPSRLTLGPLLRKEETAFEQIKKLGYSPNDVTDIIATHLDLDHAGGIHDFPHARVHVARRELSNAKAQRGFFESQRYRKQQISGDVRWNELDISVGEKWNGFETVKEIEGLPPEILVVNLPGHTSGHLGVAVQISDSMRSPAGHPDNRNDSREAGERDPANVASKSRWLLHAGDAYYHRNELRLGEKVPSGLKLFQHVVHDNFELAIETQKQLAVLKQMPNLSVFCSHDPKELEDLSGT
jgi:glyoxylase-like metal-dependent hydrolase (beta-lactamase superfamily II)